jgi:hypothetical protein
VSVMRKGGGRKGGKGARTARHQTWEGFYADEREGRPDGAEDEKVDLWGRGEYGGGVIPVCDCWVIVSDCVSRDSLCMSWGPYQTPIGPKPAG